MQLILLSGGSGKRLWPLSNDSYSKQFLRLLPAPDGTKESMLQRVVRQIRESGLEADVTIATGENQVGTITDKQSSEHVKPLVNRINDRPMYEERRWGTYKVIDRYAAQDERTRSLTRHLCIKAGKDTSYQMHFHRDEVWTFVDGTGKLALDGEVRDVKKGDAVFIRKGQKHAVKAVTDLHFVEVQIGDNLTEEDIERFDFSW